MEVSKPQAADLQSPYSAHFVLLLQIRAGLSGSATSPSENTQPAASQPGGRERMPQRPHFPSFQVAGSIALCHEGAETWSRGTAPAVLSHHQRPCRKDWRKPLLVLLSLCPRSPFLGEGDVKNLSFST